MKVKQEFEEELRSKKICRFCMDQDAPLTKILSNENCRENAVALQMMIMSCVSIEVFPDDKIPGYICDTCHLLMEHNYRFKSMCRNADLALRQYPLTKEWPEKIQHPQYPSRLMSKLGDISDKDSLTADIKPVIVPPKNTPVQVTEPPSKLGPPKNQPVQVTEPLSKQGPPKYQPVQVTEPPSKLGPPKNQQVQATEPPSKLGPPKILNKNFNTLVGKKRQSNTNDQESDHQQTLTEKLTDKPNTFQCELCDRSFPSRQLLDIHTQNHSGERLFECTFCSRKFLNKSDLAKHVLTHTDQQNYKFPCESCDKSFQSSDELKKHFESHEKVREFKCVVCDKSFLSKEGLERHERLHAVEQSFTCEYCDMIFGTADKLAHHLTAHAGRRPFPCSHCSKSYLVGHHLHQHMRSHTALIDKHQCVVCAEEFQSHEKLIYHSLIHAIKTLKCPICCERFKSVSAVTKHSREHEALEQHACEFCDLIFLTEDALEAHSRDQHKEDCERYDHDEATRLVTRELTEIDGLDDIVDRKDVTSTSKKTALKRKVESPPPQAKVPKLEEPYTRPHYNEDDLEKDMEILFQDTEDEDEGDDPEPTNANISKSSVKQVMVPMPKSVKEVQPRVTYGSATQLKPTVNVTKVILPVVGKISPHQPKPNLNQIWTTSPQTYSRKPKANDPRVHGDSFKPTNNLNTPPMKSDSKWSTANTTKTLAVENLPKDIQRIMHDNLKKTLESVAKKSSICIDKRSLGSIDKMPSVINEKSPLSNIDKKTVYNTDKKSVVSTEKKSGERSTLISEKSNISVPEAAKMLPKNGVRVQKVKKVMMTKAKVAEMVRQGKIEMRGTKMVMTKKVTPSKDAKKFVFSE